MEEKRQNFLRFLAGRKTTMPSVYFNAALLGAVAGMRSMTAPALITNALDRDQSDDLVDSPLEWMAAPLTANVFRALAAGEILADKLPSIPARTAPLPLIARLLTGALSGAALCVAAGEDLSGGAVLGAAGAFVSAHLFYRLRRWIGESTPLPDPAIAVAEDALALGMGRLIFPKPSLSDKRHGVK